MGFNTKAFGTIYKRIQTGSYLWQNGSLADIYAGYAPSASWYDIDNLAATPRVSSSFINFPKDDYIQIYIPGSGYFNILYPYTTTRNSASNAGYAAIPWGSMACDFLWNVKTPQWTVTAQSSSFIYFDGVTNRVGGSYTSSVWIVSLDNTGSFYRQYGAGVSSYGVASYDVTSSWYVWDSKFRLLKDQYSPLRLGSSVYSSGGSGLPAGTYTITQSYVGIPVSTNITAIDLNQWKNVGYPITWPNTGSAGSDQRSLIDNQYFDRGGGAAISRAAVSSSMAVQRANQTATLGVNLAAYYGALKGRRLYYPTTVSGSGTAGGTDYWHKQMTGYKSTDMFNENGGIYNVQFTLKREIVSNHYPDNGSYMNVFIHDVATKTAPVPSERTPGTKGWYPPANNIVTIGQGYSGGPLMTFVDQQTGYLYERFNINLVQYGTPAQLCFEPSGSLDAESYFGIIIDDVSICKIGVTTDPRFIKPTTVATATSYGIGEGQSAPPVRAGE